jgi:hypothetical protein
MAIDKAFVALAAGVSESVHFTVKLDVPVAVGVPLIVPLDEPRERPVGSLPEEIDHAYGVTPPVAATVAL